MFSFHSRCDFANGNENSKALLAFAFPGRSYMNNIIYSTNVFEEQKFQIFSNFSTNQIVLTKKTKWNGKKDSL